MSASSRFDLLLHSVRESIRVDCIVGIYYRNSGFTLVLEMTSSHVLFDKNICKTLD